MKASAEDGCLLCGRFLELIESNELKVLSLLGLSIWRFITGNFGYVFESVSSAIWRFLRFLGKVRKCFMIMKLSRGEQLRELLISDLF
jgi:hypothetical protein